MRAGLSTGLPAKSANRQLQVQTPKGPKGKPNIAGI